ncbi:unnamed protein product [Bemisia tabaci]|uniref:Translation factor GUF1 homolog, mitochondrial n=1 Tax=Bemisia tabaci TaxID=7038 RepID=A0A9P0F8Z4_BEMTA|nr:unnamed protein product [Bemisia tabaci]
MIFRLKVFQTYPSKLSKHRDHLLFSSSFLSRSISISQSFAAKPGSDQNEEGSNKISEKLKSIPISRIRNFSIIAHVDHGKSTLADRLLEITDTLRPEAGKQQVLDRLQVEKERGITVKAQTVSIFYNYKGEEYLLNLIDTPGHVDFANEVSRSLAACQGVILLIDANQGIQAQTVANFYLALFQELVIIPVLNKVDLKTAQPEAVIKQLGSLFDVDPETVLKISAKLGTGCDEVLKAIIERIPAPQSNPESPLKALIFDSWYNKYQGAVSLLSIKDGSLKKGDTVVTAHSGKQYIVKSVGILRPHEEEVETLSGGHVGYMMCNMRSTAEAKIGDTVYLKNAPVEPLPGFRPPRPIVFAGVYPMDQSEHIAMKKALEKLALNDPAVTVIPDTSAALGAGWRLGFLGLLHLEVFSQRLEQEYDATSIMTAPGVTYKVRIKGDKIVRLHGKELLEISNPAHWPEQQHIVEVQEPMVLGTLLLPEQYYNQVAKLCIERRGVEQESSMIDKTQMMCKFILPLNEIIVDFHDAIKSVSSGFASFDYEDHGYEVTDVTKVDILLNQKKIEELSMIVHVSKVKDEAKRLVDKLVEIVPRQQFHIAVQAVVGAKVLSRGDIKPYRKDVTAKLYGGDLTRKYKKLRQQAEGKKKLKMVGNIQLHRETFIEVLKR